MAASPDPRAVRRPSGETWVWFTALGLGLGIILVGGLLLLVISRGLAVFWPRDVQRWEVAASATAPASVVVGQVADARTRRPVGATAAVAELLVFRGNKQQLGSAFQFVQEASITAVSRPESAMVIERLREGTLIGFPRRLSASGQAPLDAADPGFAAALDAAIAQSAALREASDRIREHDIGVLARRQTALKRQQARAAPEQEAALAGEHAAVQAEIERMTAQAAALQARADQSTLDLVLFDESGDRVKPITISAAAIVDWHQPNRMGTLARFGLFCHRLWVYVSTDPREVNTEGGIYPAIFGTFFMTILMSLAVVPFGVVAALYLREYAKQGLLVRSVRICVNNLAGVPSIVFGVFGLGFFVYIVGGGIDWLLFSDHPSAVFKSGGVLWAALTLALMTVPVVIVATEESVAAVPRGMREGSLACGASKWQTIQRVILPSAVPGIITGMVLAMARGAGEVAPLMMVGVVKQANELPVSGVWLDTDLIPFLHLNQQFMHLGFHIYDLGFQSPDSDAVRPLVFATTLVLILVVLILNLGAIIIRDRLRRRFQSATF